jgi:hypothetical protein
MSEELAPAFGDSNAMAKELLKAMPEETRKSAIVCWSMHRHLQGMDTPLPIASMLSHWIGDDFTTDDATECMKALCLPERMAEHKFPTDFTCDFANIVVKLKAARRKKRDADARRGPEIGEEEAARVREMLARLKGNIGTDPNESKAA